MSHKCCIPNCNSASGRSNVPLYIFPHEEKQELKWIESISYGRLRNVKGNPCRYYVCAKHFEKRFITRPGSTRMRTRLLSNAYPTLFSDSEISSGIPKTQPNDNADTKHSYPKKWDLVDHTYLKSEQPEEFEFNKTEICAVNEVKEYENKEENDEITGKEKKAVVEPLRCTNIADFFRSWTEATIYDSPCVNKTIGKPISTDFSTENKENGKEANLQSKNEADIENAEVDNHITSISYSDEKFSTADCVNKTIENPITKAICAVNEKRENENKEEKDEIKDKEKETVADPLRYTKIVDFFGSWTDSPCVNEAIGNPITTDVTTENMENRKKANENKNEADIENAEVDDHFISCSDEKFSTADCVNKTIENPITKDNADTKHSYLKKLEHEDHTYCTLEPPEEFEFNKTEGAVNEKKENENNEEENKIKEKQKKAVDETLRSTNIVDFFKSCSEDIIYESKSLNDDVAIENPIPTEVTTENMENAKEANEESKNEADIENAEVDDHFISCSDKKLPTADCVNKDTDNPITKDAVVPSIVPSGPLFKVRRRRVDNNKKTQKSKKAQPQNVDKSLAPNSAIAVLKYLRNEKSFKKVSEKMTPLAKEIMWKLIEHCSTNAQGTMSAEEKHNVFSTLKQVRSVADSCIHFLSMQATT